MINYEEVHALFKHHRSPVGFVADLVEYPGGGLPPEYYAIRFYRVNFDKLTKMERFWAMDWANKTLGLMNTLIKTVPEIWQTPEAK